MIPIQKSKKLAEVGRLQNETAESLHFEISIDVKSFLTRLFFRSALLDMGLTIYSYERQSNSLQTGEGINSNKMNGNHLVHEREFRRFV